MASVFKREEEKSSKKSNYVASWYDAEIDQWRQTAAYTDRTLSLMYAQRLENERAARREGFTSNTREESVRPIVEQLKEFLIDRDSRGADTSYLSQLESRISRVIEVTKSKRLLDISAAKFQAAILEMRTKRGFEAEGKPLSVSTRNEYLNSMKCFTSWAHENRKLEHDPLAPLSKCELKQTESIRVVP